MNELLLLIKKDTDTLIDQTKTKSQETLEIKMNESMQTFSFSPPINLVQEGKWLLGKTSIEATNSVFDITHGNNSFSTSTPNHWNSEDGEEFVNKPNKLLDLKSEKDIELQIKEVEKNWHSNRNSKQWL